MFSTYKNGKRNAVKLLFPLNTFDWKSKKTTLTIFTYHFRRNPLMNAHVTHQEPTVTMSIQNDSTLSCTLLRQEQRCSQTFWGQWRSQKMTIFVISHHRQKARPTAKLAQCLTNVSCNTSSSFREFCKVEPTIKLKQSRKKPSVFGFHRCLLSSSENEVLERHLWVGKFVKIKSNDKN